MRKDKSRIVCGMFVFTGLWCYHFTVVSPWHMEVHPISDDSLEAAVACDIKSLSCKVSTSRILWVSFVYHLGVHRLLVKCYIIHLTVPRSPATHSLCLHWYRWSYWHATCKCIYYGLSWSYHARWCLAHYVLLGARWLYIYIYGSLVSPHNIFNLCIAT